MKSTFMNLIINTEMLPCDRSILNFLLKMHTVVIVHFIILNVYIYCYLFIIKKIVIANKLSMITTVLSI